MFNAAQQGLALAAAAVGIPLASLALRGSRKTWRHHHNPVDLAMSVAACVWLVHLLATTSFDFVASNFPSVEVPSIYVARLGYQALMVSVGFFLLTSAGVTSARVYLLLVVQGAAGVVALHWPYWTGGEPTPAYEAWLAINLLSAILLSAAVAWRVYLSRSYPAWLALAGCVIGLGLCIDQITLADNARRFATMSDDLYAAFLMVIWHLVTQRVRPPELRSALMHDFQHSTDLEPLTGFGPAHDAAVVALERRRIAQDLHDGVGSQIVNILSSLDSHAPQQQAVALALEQCLVDLKMTVDAIDSANDNVLVALGRLRYRVQHSLDTLGIRMIWKVEICDELEAVRGEPAQQALRIAQESLSNVMRHAHASVVEVVCRFVPETQQMVLEVRDNGEGIARSKEGRPSGKGLEGMRRRAQSIGAELVISSKAGTGTRVRLVLPLAGNQALPQPSTTSRELQPAKTAEDKTADSLSPHTAG
ncbi:sensor histidine kinase [Polaromonas sp. JS666]|uniref:sensor histidine kinase n=1 Tax=Polaromonas sp. (strain JS666 / ATCC BAA-500) TaxID=296591 RepID=UPI000046479E|nr:ATP-binding protein [Polaromonas sp. JS666]ABE44458.1 periplasmic sensor signal transduction histidine kinase [Polaromonas sp. JS666]